MTNHMNINGARLCSLLVDKGGEALRNVFDRIHNPATLTATLAANRAFLRSLRIVRPEQMDTMFPPSGAPSQSTDYDITLLSILLRQICGIYAPATGWINMPSPGDLSEEADLVRVRIYRNEIYGHLASLDISDAEFRGYWKKVKPVLIRLGVDPGEIARLRYSPVDVKRHIELLNEWKDKEDDIKEFLSKDLRKSKWCNTVFIPGILICLLFLVSVLVFQQLHPKPQFTVDEDLWTPLLNVSNSSFFGRQWFYRELEGRFTKNKTLRGVLTLADQGWGKSAVMQQLIKSPNTSQFIHQNIFAYHFCKADEKSTRDGEEFVKGLVHMISKKSEEFKNIVERRSIRKELNDRCKNDPSRCFRVAILEPLREISKPENDVFILIDALNECREKEQNHRSVIINILYRYVGRLPGWIKLIVTSTNDTSIRNKMTEIGLAIIHIDATDSLNSEDIRSYAEQVIQGSDFKIENGTKSMQKELMGSIDFITKTARGNFLYVEKLLEYWKDHPENINLKSLPPALNHYGLTFRSRYRKEQLKHFTPLLEVLLASSTPPTKAKLGAILSHLDRKYDADEVIDEILPHLKISSDGTVRFFHESFIEWLENHTERVDGLIIQTARGHQYIANYLFDYYVQRKNTLQLEGLSELSMHVVFGGMMEEHVSYIKGLQFEKILDRMFRCILHELAGKRGSTPAFEVFIKRFNSVDIVDLTYWTPSFYAISAGNYENLQVLIQNKADVDIAISNNMFSGIGFDGLPEQNMYTTKPLDLAIPTGNLDIVKLLMTEGANADAFALYQAANNNHSHVLKFLLDREVKDKCLPCERFSGRRETALSAAVSNGFINVTKTLLFYKADSLECKDDRGRTPLIRAVERNDTKMAILLIEEGADIEAKCEDDNDIWLDQYYCPCGNRAIHLSAMFDSWEIARALIDKNADVFSRNCMRWSALELAAFYDNVNFIQNFFSIYEATAKQVVNNKTILSYLAACGSARTLELFAKRSNKSIFTEIFDYGMTLLHIATLSSVESSSYDDNHRLCSIVNCSKFICPYKDYMHKPFTNLYEKRSLNTVLVLTEQAPEIVDKKDKRGRTAFHYAALLGSTHIVKHLENIANWNITDKSGQTPLELALTMEPLPPFKFVSDRMTNDVFHPSLNTAFDETVSRLIVLQNSTLKTCDENSTWLVGELIRHELPFSLFTLFKIGLNATCSGTEHFKQYLMELHLKSSTGSFADGKDIIEVFKIFELNISVNCGVPFNQSVLHLLMYLNLGESVGNVFLPSVNNVSSPFQRLADSHGIRLFENCYDNEGFLPIHRAVQGENVKAIKWLLKIGVDVWIETKTGWTALDLMLKYWSYHYRRAELEEILTLFTKTTRYESQTKLWCNSTRATLSPLHIAASDDIGKLRYVHNQISSLPLTCANKHRFQPLYIVYFYHQYAIEEYTWPENKKLFEDLGLSVHGKPFQYPQQRAEQHLIFNYLYETPLIDLSFELNLEGLFQCPGINETLPHSNLVDRQIKRCYNRCWQSAYQVSHDFLSTFGSVQIGNDVFDGFVDITAQMSEIRYRSLKTVFTFNVSSSLWRRISKAYHCSYKCRCLEIMQLLRKRYINKIVKNKNDVQKLMAERMVWNDSYPLKDLLFRWPFGFFLEKALKNRTYEYLGILDPKFSKLTTGDESNHMNTHYESRNSLTTLPGFYSGNCSGIIITLMEHFIARREQSTRVGQYIIKRLSKDSIRFNGKRDAGKFQFGFLLKRALKKFKLFEYLKLLGHCLDGILYF